MHLDARQCVVDGDRSVLRVDTRPRPLLLGQAFSQREVHPPVKPELLEQLRDRFAAVHSFHPRVLGKRGEGCVAAGAGEDRPHAHRVHELEVGEVRDHVRDRPFPLALGTREVGLGDAVDREEQSGLKRQQLFHAPILSWFRCWNPPPGT